MKQSRNCSEQKLTIGFDLGDRSSWYCVLDEAGRVRLEQRVSTTPKAMKAKGAYDRLAAVKFREHKCEAETSLSAAKQETKRSVAASAFKKDHHAVQATNTAVRLRAAHVIGASQSGDQEADQHACLMNS